MIGPRSRCNMKPASSGSTHLISKTLQFPPQFRTHAVEQFKIKSLKNPSHVCVAPVIRATGIHTVIRVCIMQAGQVDCGQALLCGAFKFTSSSWIISSPPPSLSCQVLLLSCGSCLSRLTMAKQLPKPKLWLRLNVIQCVHCNERERIPILLVILSQMIQFRSVCNHHTQHLFNEIFLSCSRPIRATYWVGQWCDDLERGNDNYRIMADWRSHIGHYSCKLNKLRIIVNAYNEHPAPASPYMSELMAQMSQLCHYLTNADLCVYGKVIQWEVMVAFI